MIPIRMLLLLFLLSATPSTLIAAPPNFVFTLADDRAWNGLSRRMVRDLPESSRDFHRAPNLDRLGSQSMTF